MAKQTFPPVQFDGVVCGGGLDQVTPTLSLKNGVARYALNFAPGMTGGYERTGQYERFDGRTAPSSTAITRLVIAVTALMHTPTLYETVSSSGGATAKYLAASGTELWLTAISGTFAVGEALSAGGDTVGVVSSIEAGPDTPKEEAQLKNAAADYYRSLIAAVPGTGNVLGVVMLNDVVYAFRNKADGTICEGYKSTPSGWAKLTGSLTKGLPIEFTVGSIGGAATAIYGVNGTDAFWINGTTITALTSPPASPQHIAIHANRLWLSSGAHLYYSDLGGITWVGDAGEIATINDGTSDRFQSPLDSITALVQLPGGTSTPTLGVFTRSNTHVLYGATTADWNLVSYNTGTGAVAGTVQNMAQTMAFDDRGVVAIQTALQYGNFVSSTITSGVLPFIQAHKGLATCGTLIRGKSQYRVFFSNGDALVATIVNGKSLGVMPLYFPDPVLCCWEGKSNSGEDVVYFGSSDGMIYQMEKGTSADGDDIEFSLVLNYANAKSPRVLKRYRKMALEVMTSEPSYLELAVGYALGYDSLEYWQDDVDGHTAHLGPGRWDQFTWDNFWWDSRGVEPLEVEVCGAAENVAFIISGASDFCQSFLVNSMIIHYTPRRVMR